MMDPFHINRSQAKVFSQRTLIVFKQTDLEKEGKLSINIEYSEFKVGPKYLRVLSLNLELQELK
jgi:hypothetical protein